MQYASLIDKNKMQSQQMLCFIPFYVKNTHICNLNSILAKKVHHYYMHPYSHNVPVHTFASNMFKKGKVIERKKKERAV